jgi:SAM-dependent methyltransferase
MFTVLSFFLLPFTLPPTTDSLSNLPPSDQAVSQDELARAMDSIERYSIPGLQSYTVVDPSEARVANALAAAEVELEAVPADKQYALNAVVGDLDKADYGEGYDLIVSNLALHWENDLPTVFNKAMAALKPNGAFIGAVIGGESLRELRSSFTVAGLERRGGVTQHVSPLTRPRDIGDLLGAAGFQMLTVDMDALTVQYPDMFTLCDHLQRMGEQNAPAVSSAVPRDIFLAAQAAYEALYKDPESGLLVCSVDVVMFIGWKYHDSMHKASSRGTANAKLGDIIEEANNDK